MAFVTYPLNNVLYQAEDAELYNSTRQSGLFAADDFSYEVSGADSNITIGEGIGWIKNGRFAGKVFANKTNEVLDLGLPDATLPRLDVVAIRFDKAANATSLVIKNGTASSVPTIPTISRTESVYELYICSVRREPGAIVVTNADISDLRLDESVCGLMRDAVTGIPTEELYAQFMARLERLDEALSATLAGNIPPHAATHSKDGSDWVTPASIGAAEAPTELTAMPSSGTALTNGAEYRVSAAVGTYAFAWPSSPFEAWLKFTVASSFNITFPSGTTYIGGAPSFNAGSTYEMSVKDGVVICQEVTA